MADLEEVEVVVAHHERATLRVGDATVVEAMNAPVGPAEDAVFRPEGQQLDSPLSRAILDALPEGTTFGFNGAGGRTWIHVFGPAAASAAPG